MYEGREVHVSNIDFKAKEEDVKEVFSKYGTVELVRIPKKADGGSKGFGYVVFSSKVSSIENDIDSMLTATGRGKRGTCYASARVPFSAAPGEIIKLPGGQEERYHCSLPHWHIAVVWSQRR